MSPSRFVALVAALFLVVCFLAGSIACGGGTTTTSSGPKCTTGKRCGNTCIARDKTCHK